MKKMIVGLILLVILFWVSGCATWNAIPKNNTVECVSAQYKKDKLEEYDTPYTTLYKNKNGTYDLFIFASPVQFQDETGKYLRIDNRLVSSERKDCAFENKANAIKMYFPERLNLPFIMEKEEESIQFKFDGADYFQPAKKCSFTNMYGDYVESVEYSSPDGKLYFYPTNSGIRMERHFKLNDNSACTSFSIDLNGKEMNAVEDAGYVSLYQGDKRVGMVYASLSQNEGKDGYISNEIERLDSDVINENKLNFEYKIGEGASNDKSVKSELSFEFYANKMPDSTAYSQMLRYPYLANYYELGSKKKGDANHYFRLRLNYFLSTTSENILHAEYHIKPLTILNDRSPAVELYSVAGQWSSTNLTWENKAKTGEKISDALIDSQNRLCFDITEYVKACFNDFSMLQESYGGMLTSKESIWMATSDNALYPPYIKITLEKLPMYFEKTDNINNVEF